MEVISCLHRADILCGLPDPPTISCGNLPTHLRRGLGPRQPDQGSHHGGTQGHDASGHTRQTTKLPFCWTALSFPIQKPFQFISVGQQNDSAGPRVGHTGRRRAGWNGWHCASGRQPRIHRDQFRGGPAELRSDYADLRTRCTEKCTETRLGGLVTARKVHPFTRVRMPTEFHR